MARRGDTVADVAARVGLSAEELARFNGLQVGYVLRADEILALPRRVPASGPDGGRDIATIAGDAIDRAEGTRRPVTGTTAPAEGQPVRHRVERGETAYSIARLYNVSVRSLAEWNGLGTDLTVREGQYLLIPVAAGGAAPDRRIAATRPGRGSPTPVPPSASTPLPDPAEVETAKLPESPKLSTAEPAPADTSRFLRPVDGKTIRPYGNGNDGIDLAAAPGTAVRAADNGKVALISRSVGQSTIVLVRHDDNIYTVYSNVTDVPVKKGDSVKRGQPVGKVAEGSPGFVHFEVRRGTKATDPGPFIN